MISQLPQMRKYTKLLPLVNYKDLFADWQADLIAGITVAVVALPLALAFAVASGVEPKVGLYTAIVTGIVGSAFGGSRYQITGPTGAMSVILIEIVAKYGIEKVWIAGVMAGIIQLALGITKLGKFVKFIPYPVTVGFTNGIAAIIFSGQLNNFFGLQVPKQEDFVPSLWATLTHLSSLNLMALIVGSVAIVTQITWPRLKVPGAKKVPGSLVGLVLATVITCVFHLQVPTIGAIPQTLPTPQLFGGWNDLEVMRELLNPAIAIAALGAIEALLSAVVADSMTVSDKHDSDRELIGQGLANIASPFFGGIPCTGAIARTAVNVRSGAKTRLAGIIHGVVLAAIVVVLAPLASKIPMAALASILMVTSFRMIEWEAIGLLAQARNRAADASWGSQTLYTDFGVMLLTWLVTVAFDLVLAVEVGLAAAAALFIRNMSNLHLSPLRDSWLFPPGVPPELSEQIAVYRLDSPLFFGAAERFVTLLRRAPQVKFLILRMRFMHSIDTTGLVALEEIHNDLKRHDCRLILTGLQSPVLSLLERTGLLAKIGSENCHTTTNEAIRALAHLLNEQTRYKKSQLRPTLPQNVKPQAKTKPRWHNT